MKNLFKLSLAALLAVGMAACSSSQAATDTKDEDTKEETTEETAAEEAEEVSASYKITNTTGEVMTELYVYETGSADKGENYAGEGLKDSEAVTITFGPFTAEEAEGIAYTVEFKTESGYTSAAFDHLHVEEAAMNILSQADVESAATPWEWAF